MKQPARLLMVGMVLSHIAFCQQSVPVAVLSNHIRGEMEFLASDVLQGRGSGTRDELIAATYLASELSQLGLKPGGDNGGFIQNIAVDFESHSGTKLSHTRNVIAILPGQDLLRKDQVVLLSAHMDHFGIGKHDKVYPGADDDASGCVAVLELARALVQSGSAKRTVLFVFFGSEETGGQGSDYFLDHPPVSLKNIVANLEFEMIGRSDSAIKADELWLTGYERSDLGSELARHGAKLVVDPHPAERFFERSDNYGLARKGVIAHTVSSFGLHKDYHEPGDDLAHIDFTHMERAIKSMIGPVKWLVNSGFKPQWLPGKKP